MTKISWVVLILFGLVLGFVLGRLSGNVSSALYALVPEIVERSPTDDEVAEQVRRLREAYETMLKERQKPSQEVATKAVREVIMFTKPGCVWCDKWLREQFDNFDRLGYKIATTEDHNLTPIPQFQVTDEKGVRHYVGYIDARSFGGQR